MVSVADTYGRILSHLKHMLPLSGNYATVLQQKLNLIKELSFILLVCFMMLFVSETI
jgi:hypothetical protein